MLDGIRNALPRQRQICRGTGAGRHHARAAGGILGLVLVVFLVLWLLGALGVHHA
jgi:Protein of unknown function (DUF3309)